MRNTSKRNGGKWMISGFVALGLLFAACGGDDGAGGAGTTVDVRLQEFAVLPAQPTAPAGSTTFRAENTGPANAHELVVIRTDLAPDKLPVKADGSVDETGTGITVIGEIEEFAVGQTKSATFDMQAGAYVLFCNVVQTKDGKVEAHYKQGMRTAFTVT
jgi:hypothetical protein